MLNFEFFWYCFHWASCFIEQIKFILSKFVSDKLSKSEGYGEWLKSDEDMNPDKVSKNNMNEYIENKKRELRAIQPVNNVKELSNNTYSNLLGNNDNDNLFFIIVILKQNVRL